MDIDEGLCEGHATPTQMAQYRVYTLQSFCCVIDKGKMCFINGDYNQQYQSVLLLAHAKVS